MILQLEERPVTIGIDAVTEARDGLEDSGLTDHPDVARALLLLRRIADDYNGTVWGAADPAQGKVLPVSGQEAAEYLVESLGAPWVLAVRDRDGNWMEVGR